MGLDACLVGNTANLDNDEYQFCSTFGSWRKHWGLHAFVVANFGGGMEKYNETHFIEVMLSADNLKAIIAAIEEGKLQPQAGADTKGDLQAFQRALAWLEEPGQVVTRLVIYAGDD